MTTTTAERYRAYRGLPLCSMGFRPFSLLVAISAAFAVPAWVAAFADWLPIENCGRDWHAHEMLFGGVIGLLLSAFALGEEILTATRRHDIGDAQGLRPCESNHGRATFPLFAATNAIARLYADERKLARLARGTALRLMNLTPGARWLVETNLSGVRA